MITNSLRLKKFIYVISGLFFTGILADFGLSRFGLDSIDLSGMALVLALVINLSVFAFGYFLPVNNKSDDNKELFSLNN